VLQSPTAHQQTVKADTTKYTMANFTAAINALVAERDRVFLVSVSEQFNLPFEQLSKLYLETAEQAIKVPRKYTKKPKAVTVAVEGAPEAPAKPAKEPKAKAEKQKCTACTSKKEPCKFSALKGEVFCKRHLRASQEEGTEPKPKAAKAPKAAKPQPLEPVHTHELGTAPSEPCDLCATNGNPLAHDEEDFEIVMDAPAPAQTAAERLAALLAETDSESDSDDELDAGLAMDEEAYEDE
jgi:hypothetical protein